MPPTTQTETTPQVPTSTKFKLDKKWMIVIGSVIAIVVIVIVVAVLLLSQPKNTEVVNNSQTSQNLPTTNNTGKTSASATLATLPANTCPDSIHTDANGLIADYQNKPYAVDSATNTWIQQNCSNKTSGIESSSQQQNQVSTETEPPLLLKSIGFNLEDYNPTTQTAGDIKFTNIPLPFDEIFGPYGQQDPRSPNDPTKINPQPTVILPLGTDVHSLVDGIVVDVKTLYSGDSTIWVAKSKDSTWFYETEHVNNPLVAIGDTVTAGQVIGKVSDYDSHNNPGFGLVEIGILHPNSINGTPEHYCPYNYLDPSIKESVNSKLLKLYSGWESYLGKEIYNQETFVTPGCVTLNKANG